MDAITDIEGVLLTPLRVIAGPGGSVLHGLRSSAPGFNGFGEAYFSTVENGFAKGWKKHRRMVLNLVVPAGAIRFVLVDDRPASRSRGVIREVTLGRENYQRLTVPPEVWMAFQGRSPGANILMNVASIEHDPLEAEGRGLDDPAFAAVKFCA